MQKGFLVDLTAINARNASLSEEGDFLEEPGLRHQGGDLLLKGFHFLGTVLVGVF